jgi:non-ribosomal peptide synthetase component F
MINPFDNQADLDIAHTLHGLVHAQAKRTPDAIAVESGPHRISYHELDLAARRFAGVLIERGVTAGSPVGVWCNRGPKLLVALLGVLHAGAVFIPLDPDLPAARAQTLLAEAAAGHCVVDDPPCGPVDGLATDLHTVHNDAGDPLTVPVDPDDLVSIYYTSGSTGKPKGVANHHRGWVNRMQWMQDRHQLRPGEGVLHKTVLSFDDSAVELFWPLIIGGRVVMLEPGLHRDPRAIARAAAVHEVAALQFVPSMLALFLEELEETPLPTLRHVISSGEALRPELVQRFYEVFDSTGCLLHNQWGATETSIDATIHTCSPEDAARNVIQTLRKARRTVDTAIDSGAATLSPATIESLRDLYLNTAQQGITANTPDTTGRSHDAYKPAKRMRDRVDQILHLTLDLHVEWTNNPAEQAIRMAKLQAKISGSRRSMRGLTTFCRIRSYIATAKAHGIEILTALHDASLDNPWTIPTTA